MPRSVPTLQVEGTLSLARGVERKIEGAAIQPGQFALHEQIEGVAGELVSQERVGFACLLDLALMRVQLVQRLVAPALCAEDLPLDLLDLDDEHLLLVDPFGIAADPAGLRQIERPGLVVYLGDVVEDARPCGGHIAELGAEGQPRDRDRTAAEASTDRCDLAAIDGDIADERSGTSAVDDGAAANDDLVHGWILSPAVTGLSYNAPYRWPTICRAGNADLRRASPARPKAMDSSPSQGSLAQPPMAPCAST